MSKEADRIYNDIRAKVDTPEYLVEQIQEKERELNDLRLRLERANKEAEKQNQDDVSY